MNELTLTYPSLLERAFAESNDKIQQIKQTIEHYKRLGMPGSLIEKAKTGAVAVILKTFGFQMLSSSWVDRSIFDHSKSWDYSNTWRLFKVEEDGEERKNQLFWGDREQFRSPDLWQLTKLKEYKDPVPLEILEKLPNTAGENAWVFHPVAKALDPILVYPLVHEVEVREYRRVDKPTWYDRLNYEIAKRSILFPGPYFAGIYKWE